MDVDTCVASSEESIDSETERVLRSYGCELIQKAGILLQLNAVTIATGQTILHKFYFNRSFKEFDIRETAAASCFLSAKLQENMRKVKDVAKVFDYIVNNETINQGPIHHLDEVFAKRIIKIEVEILVEFGFRIDSILICPHRYVLQYIYALFRNLDEYSGHSVNQVAQKAWGYLNDCMRTNLCCKTPPRVIAVGCLYMAATDLGIPLKKETSWFTIFDANWEDIVLVSEELDKLYSMGKAYYINVNEGKIKVPTPASPVPRSADHSRKTKSGHAEKDGGKRGGYGADDKAYGSRHDSKTEYSHHRGRDRPDSPGRRNRSDDRGSDRDPKRRYDDYRGSKNWNEVREYDRYGGRGPSPFSRSYDRRDSDDYSRRGDGHRDRDRRRSPSQGRDYRRSRR
ncbi:cyclin l like protein [Babesia gibsoni]|uniref:Cyclin l like protein n=1 Tax=Babesia gibsoni TaxID=33632 RepID=A0AAD8P7Q1_BABGI|nr:cyclin l like protein [Babesia gibsoni]